MEFDESDIFDSQDFLIGEELDTEFQFVEENDFRPLTNQEDKNSDSSSASSSNAEQSTADKSNDESLRCRMSDLASHKAGLQGIDKEKVNQVIYEASKNSAFYLNEARKDEALKHKTEQLLKKYESLRRQDLSTFNNKVDNLVQAIERKRDLSRTIVHIDMDAYYASVEERDNPSLRGKPMAVGSNSMLSTSNYEARRYGVRSAMPGFIAKKLCPELIIVPCNFDKYHAVAKQIREVFARYDPNYTPMSLDEAYLDITEYLETTDKTPDEIVEQIRKEIHEETKLTASAGIAANMLLSKICSDFNKPNGQYRLPNNINDIMRFIRPLPVRKIPGIGRVTERILKEIDISTCGAILDNSVYIYRMFSSISFNFFIRAALGIGSTTVKSEYKRKSMSISRTFCNLNQPNELFAKLRELVDYLAADLAKEYLHGKTIALTFKSVSFKVTTRERSLKRYIYTADDLYHFGKQILVDELPLNIRLMGVRLSNLRSRNDECGLKKWFFNQPNSSQQSTTPKESEPELPKPSNAENSCLKRWFSTQEDTTEQEKQDKQVKRQRLNIEPFGASNSMNHDSTRKNVVDLLIERESVTTSCNSTQETNETHKWHPVPTILKKYICPGCNKQFPNIKVSQINAHLDTCLNAEDINGSDYEQDIIYSNFLVQDEQNNLDETEDANSEEVYVSDIPENSENDPEMSTDWKCPKCDKIFKKPTNMRINSHLDNCLKTKKGMSKTSLRKRRNTKKCCKKH
ncbi:DNA/RNA polymerase [Gigaspora margarita]|uniref:DNA polymerase kappa n=2 Tax=Gigaspora margarita TaxID=4874 RepID=A0A8H4B3J7_GIGMA|nr:DNA/RNA polymerase [Gigaspora margarita]